MSAEPAEDVEMHKEEVAAEQDAETSSHSGDGSDAEAPADLMVTTRVKRANAGNRMSILLAKSAEEEEEWGEEWEEAAVEEEFKGEDVNEQEDYNMDSSSSEEEYGGDNDDEAGEKELRKAERQERRGKRKAVTNPFTARIAVVARKKVKLDMPHDHSPSDMTPRPKKKSERASWLPTEEDGPIRTSLRKQTVANKAATLSKLKEKDRKRDDTLAMMKAAEARKEKDAPKPLTQAERLAEAARNERINKKTLHRWEEAEETRAAERQAKIDAMKNRQMDGPFIRYYTGPAIWVDEKIKYTGKEAPTLEALEEKLNKEPSATDAPEANNSEANNSEQKYVADEQRDGTPVNTSADGPPNVNGQSQDRQQQSHVLPNTFQPVTEESQGSSVPTSLPHSQPWTAVSQGNGGDVFMGSNGMSAMFASAPAPDSFLSGIDQYAQKNSSGLPPNPFTQASPFNTSYTTAQPTYPQQQPHPSLNDPLLLQHNGTLLPQDLLTQFQRPQLPLQPPRKRIIRRALRNLLILSSFPNLDLQPSSSRARSAAGLLKDKDRAALIQLSTTLFNWTTSDATAFVNSMLSNPSSAKLSKKAIAEREAALKPTRPLCAVTNAVARYRDPETGIAYRDSRAFGVLRGVVGGGFVWSGDLGCYVGGRAKPLESMGGKGFLGMPPVKGVPKRFLEMSKKSHVPAVQKPTLPHAAGQTGDAGVVQGQTDGHANPAALKTETTGRS